MGRQDAHRGKQEFLTFPGLPAGSASPTRRPTALISGGESGSALVYLRQTESRPLALAGVRVVYGWPHPWGSEAETTQGRDSRLAGASRGAGSAISPPFALLKDSCKAGCTSIQRRDARRISPHRPNALIDGALVVRLDAAPAGRHRVAARLRDGGANLRPIEDRGECALNPGRRDLARPPCDVAVGPDQNRPSAGKAVSLSQGRIGGMDRPERHA
jgi:hypothetical protein